MNESTRQVMHSSAPGDWATPQDFFDQVNEAFKFTLDTCATFTNKKCHAYYGDGIDGLAAPWHREGCNWCNPPYGRGIGVWIEKAIMERDRGCASVLLVPARTDTKWFQLAFMNATKLFLVPGRLKFGGSKDAAPFPSAMFYFSPHVKMPCSVEYWRQ